VIPSEHYSGDADTVHADCAQKFGGLRAWAASHKFDKLWHVSRAKALQGHAGRLQLIG
jgi:hypothetical protein